MKEIKASDEFSRELYVIKDTLIHSILKHIERFGEDFNVDKERFNGVGILIEETSGEYGSYSCGPQFVGLRICSISSDGGIYACTEDYGYDNDDDEYNDEYVTLSGLSIGSLLTVLSKLEKVR